MGGGAADPLLAQNFFNKRVKGIQFVVCGFAINDDRADTMSLAFLLFTVSESATAGCKSVATLLGAWR